MSEVKNWIRTEECVHVTEGDPVEVQCWCRPRLASACPTCGGEGNRWGRRCATCDGGGLVDADPQGESAVIVIHRELVSKCCLAGLRRVTDTAHGNAWLECAKCGEASGTYELVEGD